MKKKIILLDGGMGQELIKNSKSDPHPLWSTYVMLEEPDLVRKAHVDFIEAGASVITLNTSVSYTHLTLPTTPYV